MGKWTMTIPVSEVAASDAFDAILTPVTRMRFRPKTTVSYVPVIALQSSLRVAIDCPDGKQI